MARFPLATIIARRRRAQTPVQIERSLRVGRIATLFVIGAIALVISVGTAWLLRWWLT